MAAKTAGKSGGSVSQGLVPKSVLRSDSPPWLFTFIQQIGEARFDVETIGELKLQDRRSWFTFTRRMAKAGDDFSKLAQALQDLVAEETAANVHLATEQASDLIARRKAESKHAAKKQRREEVGQERALERDAILFKEEQTERKQRREERQDRHSQSLAERETWRKVYKAREIVLMSCTAACILFSFLLIGYGLIAEKPLFVGGSSISAGIAITGFIKMFLGWRNDNPPPDETPG